MTELDYDDPVVEEKWCHSQRELAPLFRARSEILHEWTNDDSLWEPECD